jgi:hypothetical protein
VRITGERKKICEQPRVCHDLSSGVKGAAQVVSVNPVGDRAYGHSHESDDRGERQQVCDSDVDGAIEDLADGE